MPFFTEARTKANVPVVARSAWNWSGASCAWSDGITYVV